MSQYGDVVFSGLTPNGLYPKWARRSVISSEHVPGGDVEVTQFMGRGNFRLTVRARFANAAAANQMELLAGDGVARALVLFDQNHGSVYLREYRSPQGGSAGGHHVAELEFERAGA